MGTSIQALDLGPDDFGGADLEGCNENLVLTRPDVIQGVHERFLAAGADILETDTFGSTPLVLAEYGLEAKTQAINVAAARIARAAADKFTTPDKPRFVAGSMGPTTKTISVTGGVTWDDLAEHYRQQALGLIEGGVDLLLLETTQDTLNLKAGLVGIDQAQAELEIRPADRGLVQHRSHGNAARGPGHRVVLRLARPPRSALDRAQLRDRSRLHDRPSADARGALALPGRVRPERGPPDENGRYNETPAMVAEKVGRFVDAGWVNLVGGCCGTVPDHIQRLAEGAAGKTAARSSGGVGARRSPASRRSSSTTTRVR